MDKAKVGEDRGWEVWEVETGGKGESGGGENGDNCTWTIIKKKVQNKKDSRSVNISKALSAAFL